MGLWFNGKTLGSYPGNAGSNPETLTAVDVVLLVYGPHKVVKKARRYVE